MSLKSSNAFVATIFRDPVKRLESLLSYRQCEKSPLEDWRRAKLPWQASLNTIIDYIKSQKLNLSTMFQPYGTMHVYLTTNQVMAFCTPDALLRWATSPVGLFPNCSVGHERHNVSPRKFGMFNNKSAQFVREQFHHDHEIWKMACEDRKGGILIVP